MTDVTTSQCHRRRRLSVADEQLLRELTERARAGGLHLTGQDGLLGKPGVAADLDIGVHHPLRDVQEAASHADPRTTMRYDRARASLDRHATYIVAAYIAGAAR